MIETDADGLILVDTGLGIGECESPRRLPAAFRQVFQPSLCRDETAIEQIRGELRFDPEDVRHIVVTHLDLDHAGGLVDFPWARVHVHAAEHAAATCAPSLQERFRYLRRQWSHRPRWELYTESGDDWFGFDAVRELRVGDADIALVPLFGHTRGHCGVAVNTSDGWLLHTGDAILSRRNLTEPGRGIVASLLERLGQFDYRARVDNVRRLRELADAHANEIEIVCSHEPDAHAQLLAARRARQEGNHDSAA